MLSKLRKISKDLIIYSVLISDFEKLDFKNDALAGVRANYFNAKCSPQIEKTDIIIDNRPCTLAYSMRAGEPLSWKISVDNRPVQTVKRSADGGYCVVSYGENGVVYRRQFFGGNHYWLRTEYYNKNLENEISAVVYPRISDGLMVLRLQRFLQTGIESLDLYPSMNIPKKRCTALIYSNSGMIWYDESFKPVEVADKSDNEPKGGFDLKREAFSSGMSRDLLNLKNADYLSEGDIAAPSEETVPVPEPEPKEYSAYDRIEDILFEAHKTNKNIFGELANNLIIDEPEPKAEEITEKTAEPEVEAVPEEIAEPEVEAVPEEIAEPKAEEFPEEAAEPEGEAVPEENEELPGGDEEESEPAILETPEEGEPDTLINTKNGVYAYFGELDDNNCRTGRGRTVTPEGITSYDGDYLDDKRHGFGVCYYKEGSPNYIGDWVEGNRSGRGVGFRRSDGTVHVGRWSENKPDGFGARFDKDGDFLDVCTYVGGVRNGKSVSFDEDGNVVIRIWKDGEIVGEKIISD